MHGHGPVCPHLEAGAAQVVSYSMCAACCLEKTETGLGSKCGKRTCAPHVGYGGVGIAGSDDA